ncbi:hypothetical protein L6164_020967 [Bauhinia variegata]|uniref:Uncharacterized protein n=1 Tax=Bauhinia variegata TaxID=167791 RepID=A0ACB9MY75_BAUVA|nr:hypothetical protein L6164_020967 [Bauhinia variegata]
MVTMHNLIKEMGRKIVREESPNDPGKRRHLWNHDDIYEVLKNNLGTADIESINLQCWNDKEIHLSPKVFKGMDLGNLKLINLSGCEFLKELPDMSKASKLEKVYLFFCTSLRHVHSSILSNHNLVELYLANCTRLRSLDASECRNLKEFSMLSERTCIENVPSPITLGLMNSLTILSLNYVKLVSLPASIKHLSNLQQLYLRQCTWLQSIPELPQSIKCLDASGCSSLKALFTSTCSWPGSHLINPRYPFVVNLNYCYKLGEDTMTGIVMYFVLLTIGAVYQQPTPGKLLSCNDGSLACVPLSKLPDVFNFQTRKGGYISIQVPLNSDLMAIIFCFAVCSPLCTYLSGSCFVHVSNGETMEYRAFLPIGCNIGDSVVLWYNEHFNGSIMNGIKESRALSSPTDEHTKVSFQLDGIYTRGTNNAKEVGMYPIYASELHSCFSTDIKRCWVTTSHS